MVCRRSYGSAHTSFKRVKLEVLVLFSSFSVISVSVDTGDYLNATDLRRAERKSIVADTRLDGRPLASVQNVFICMTGTLVLHPSFRLASKRRLSAVLSYLVFINELGRGLVVFRRFGVFRSNRS